MATVAFQLIGREVATIHKRCHSNGAAIEHECKEIASMKALCMKMAEQSERTESELSRFAVQVSGFDKAATPERGETCGAQKVGLVARVDSVRIPPV